MSTPKRQKLCAAFKKHSIHLVSESEKLTPASTPHLGKFKTTPIMNAELKKIPEK